MTKRKAMHTITRDLETSLFACGAPMPCASAGLVLTLVKLPLQILSVSPQAFVGSELDEIMGIEGKKPHRDSNLVQTRVRFLGNIGFLHLYTPDCT